MRRFLAISTTFSLVAAVPLSAYAKGGRKPPASKPADDGDNANNGDNGDNNNNGDENNGDNGEEGGGKRSETKSIPAKNAPATSAAPANDVQVPMPKAMVGVGQSSANETHEVVKGDTLWDLSQKYLGNPWYWPKVWSYNPQINNPHWIYPGDEVRFFPGNGDAEAPAQVDTENMQQPDEVDTGGEDDEGPMVKSDKIGYVPPKSSSFRQDGFVTDRELEGAGRLDKSFAEKEMLDNYDKVYMKFSGGDPKPGDRFFIYTTVREIKHPITGHHYGYLTHIVGTVKITGADQGTVSGIIDNTWDEVNRGYYLTPYNDKVSRVIPTKPNSSKVKGNIIESLAELVNVGEDMVVFVDKGKKDGLEEGNTLDVVRRADGTVAQGLAPGQDGYEDPKLPWEVIGTLMVVDAKDSASTCLALRSMREFVPGDVVITPGAESGPAKVSER